MSTASDLPAPRRKSVPVDVGGVTVGGDAPVVVQSMTNTDTADITKTVLQVAALARAGFINGALALLVVEKHAVTVLVLVEAIADANLPRILLAEFINVVDTNCRCQRVYAFTTWTSAE